MTIDDYHMNCNHPDSINIYTGVVVAAEDDPRIVKHQRLVEYHSAILLYNFGIIHQCLGMMEHNDDTMMMDSEEQKHRNDTSTSNSNPVVESSSTNDGSRNHDMDQNDDERSSKALLASYKILTNTLSWIHAFVRPILNEVLNEDYNNDDDDTVRHTIIEETTTLDDHYYVNKYLQVMVLINYHVLDIMDELHFPNGGPYEYHCTMMNEILNFISYLEIFYPITTSHYDKNNNNVGHGNNTRGSSASPAA